MGKGFFVSVGFTCIFAIMAQFSADTPPTLRANPPVTPRNTKEKKKKKLQDRNAKKRKQGTAAIQADLKKKKKREQGGAKKSASRKNDVCAVEFGCGLPER